MKTNLGIKCSVDTCEHNVEGCKCCLDKVEISCACGEKCTCCESFKEV